MNASQIATKRVVSLLRKGWKIVDGKMKPPKRLFANRPDLFNINESEQLQRMFGDKNE